MGRGDGIVRVGVVGADVHKRGFGARAHLPAVLHTPGLQLLAVCTRHDDTAQKAANTWGAPRWYSDHRDLMADADIDLVNVAINVPSHHPVAKAALEAGKAVYCEWPLTLSLEDSEELAALARSHGAVAAVGTQGRHAPGMQYLKELLDGGQVGRPLFFRMTHLLPRFQVRSDHWWSADEHSGALNVAFSHCSDPLQFLLGKIISVSSSARTLLPDDHYADTGEPFRWVAEDTVGILAQMETGVQGVVQTSNLSTQVAGFQLDIYGEQGQLQIKGPGYVSYSPGRLFRAEAGKAELTPLPIPDRFQRIPNLSEDSPGHTLAHALTEVARAIRGETEYHPNFDDGVRTHRLVAAIRRATRERIWVDVD